MASASGDARGMGEHPWQAGELMLHMDKVEENLSESRYRQLFERMTSGCAVYERTGPEQFVFQDFNRAAEQIDGVSREEIIGRDVREVFPGVAEFGLLAVMERVWRSGVSEDYPMACYQDQRIKGWRRNRVCRLPSGEVAAIYDDLSQQKEMGDKLFLFQHLLDQSADIIIVIDAESGRVVEANSRACQMTLYEKEEMIGMHAMDLVTLFPDLESWRSHQEQLEIKGGLLFECFARQKDGWTVPVEVSLSRVVLGRDKYDLAIVRDISERKQAESDLLASMDRLQQANGELAQLDYVMAHDLKAPIRAISNYVSFLQEDLGHLLDGEPGNYLARIGKATEEANWMIESLLAIASIGHAELEAEEIDLAGFMQELIDTAAIPGSVEVVLAKDWPKVQTSRILLHQILQNLVDNAWKYNLAPVKRIELGARSGVEGGVEMYVRDNGPGIAPEYHEQIFKVFERLHVSREHVGSGVGLTIVKKAARRLKAGLRLESEPGAGTTFYLLLPATL